MKTRLISILIAATILLSPVVHASDSVPAAVQPASTDITAKSGILMDGQTGKILFEKNSHDKLPLASVTKIMTMLLVMEHIEKGELTLDDTVTATTYASKMGGSQIWLKEGEQMTVHQLLKATAVASANDAAMALAEHVAGSEEVFVAAMNDRAADLGMKDTVFLNPTGLDAEGHYSSAYDIAVMTHELLKHPKVMEYTSIWMDSLRDGKTELVNTNKLVRFYKGATGMKTGTTNGAGSCISATATRGEMSLIAVVMGCATSKDRFDDAKRLLDFGFASFAIYKPTTVIDQRVKVLHGVMGDVKAACTIDSRLLIPAGSKSIIKEETLITDSIEAPVEVGQKLGEVVISIEGNVIGKYDITAAENVSKITFPNAFLRLLGRIATI